MPDQQQTPDQPTPSIAAAQRAGQIDARERRVTAFHQTPPWVATTSGAHQDTAHDAEVDEAWRLTSSIGRRPELPPVVIVQHLSDLGPDFDSTGVLANLDAGAVQALFRER
jgi:hypothetical protein